MKLIDKDKIIAELEKLIEIYKKCPTRNNYEDGYKGGKLIGYEDALHIINTLEVKEVDLEKENLIGTLEREVKIDAGGYPYIDCDIEFYDYDKDIPLAKEGEKVKIIVVKGE